MEISICKALYLLWLHTFLRQDPLLINLQCQDCTFFFFPSESQTPRVIEKRTRSYELELALVSNFLYLNNNNKPQILDQVLCLEVAVGMYKKIHSSRHCMFPAYLFSLLPINITWFLLEKQHCLFSSPEFLVAKPG